MYPHAIAVDRGHRLRRRSRTWSGMWPTEITTSGFSG